MTTDNGEKGDKEGPREATRDRADSKIEKARSWFIQVGPGAVCGGHKLHQKGQFTRAHITLFPNKDQDQWTHTAQPSNGVEIDGSRDINNSNNSDSDSNSSSKNSPEQPRTNLTPMSTQNRSPTQIQTLYYPDEERYKTIEVNLEQPEANKGILVMLTCDIDASAPTLANSVVLTIIASKGLRSFEARWFGQAWPDLNLLVVVCCSLAWRGSDCVRLAGGLDWPGLTWLNFPILDCSSLA
eukprot:jgi/Psemu1/35292/gm1.35292_g